MPRRVVIDPNVFISAAIAPNGAPARVIEAARTGRAHLIACPALLTELAGVLTRDRFRRYLSLDDVTRYITDLTALAIVVDDPNPIPAICRDPNDDYLIALATQAGPDVAIISGDPDLTSLDSPEVLTPRQFTDELDSA